MFESRTQSTSSFEIENEVTFKAAVGYESTVFSCSFQSTIFHDAISVFDVICPFSSLTLRPLIVGGLIKKRGLAIFPEEINGEGVAKWKWVNFVMQCLNSGVVNSWGGNINFF